MKKISSIQEAEDYIYGYDFFGNLDQAKDTLLPVLKVCEALAVQHNRAALLCRTRTYLIYLFIEFNQLDLATELAAINLNVAREQQLEDGLLYMVAIIAHLYQLTGNYSASEELVEIVQDRIPGMQDDKKVCKMYMMVADQYFFTSDRKRCLEAAAQSARYARRTDDLALKAVCMNNYAEKLLQYRELEQAADILAEGRAYAAASGNGSMLALLNGNYGYYFLLREAYEDASEYLLAAIRFYQEHEAVNKEMLFTIDLVRAYFRTGRFAEGYEWLTRLEAIAISSTANRILLDTYALLVDYHEQGGDFRAALENLKKQNAVYAIIKNEESEEKIRNLQITHEVKTIQQERDNAAKLARIKHDFLANMSHEIRTPINSILGISYLLHQDSLTAKQREYVRRLELSGGQLLGIINDVLDISKIEAGKFQLIPAPFSVDQLLRGLQDSLSFKAAEKQLALSLSLDERIPGWCVGDAVRLGQVMTNLLQNAIKFTGSGNIDLSAVLKSKQDGRVTIAFSVRDTGIGMNDVQLGKIFNAYEQAESHTQIRFGGTGLGLTISKKLVELMNGILYVTSEPGKGSTFTAEIPFDVHDADVSLQPETVRSCDFLDGKYVCIADDISENRLVLAEILQHLNPGVTIGLAENGNDLLELVRQRTPDLILTDLDMPGLNGFETTNRLREELQLRQTGIIACTASLMTLSESELKEAGFDGLLLKPFTVAQLAAVLNDVYIK